MPATSSSSPATRGSWRARLVPARYSPSVCSRVASIATVSPPQSAGRRHQAARGRAARVVARRFDRMVVGSGDGVLPTGSRPCAIRDSQRTGHVATRSTLSRRLARRSRARRSSGSSTTGRFRFQLVSRRRTSLRRGDFDPSQYLALVVGEVPDDHRSRPRRAPKAAATVSTHCPIRGVRIKPRQPAHKRPGAELAASSVLCADVDVRRTAIVPRRVPCRDRCRSARVPASAWLPVRRGARRPVAQLSRWPSH